MMNLVKILTLSGCGLLALGACCKKDHAAGGEDEKTPIGFHALSEETVVKAETSKPLSAYHQDFGVWGVARKEGAEDYVLWEQNSLAPVRRNATSGVYQPESAAYWLAGYSYHFMALAPYESGASNLAVTKGASQPGQDQLSFTFDLASQYADGNYDFDLMGAVAQATVQSPAIAHPSSQSLTFWHLLTKLQISVTFRDAAGNPTSGKLTQIRFVTDTDATYTLKSDVAKQLVVTCDAGVKHPYEILFNLQNKPPVVTDLLVVPQSVSNFELYLDFTLGTGESAVTYQDFKVNLTAGGHPSVYGYNESYHWKITIGPKAEISFKAEVAPWLKEKVGDDVEFV